MNLVPAIKKMEEEINKMNFEHKKSINELEDGLIALSRTIDTQGVGGVVIRGGR